MNLDNLNISGMGTIPGGEYNNVNISGLGTVSGDLKASNVQISGSGTFRGNVDSNALSVSGRAVFEKGAAADRADISGSFECKGDINVNYAKAYGRISIDGMLKATQIKLYGYLVSKKGLEAEEFVCKGSFMFEGLLNADKIDISIGGFCLAKEIGCEKILVRIGRASNTFNQIIQFLYSTISRKGIKNDKLVAEIIEGNDVNIEHTEASIVRGKMVRIGQGCVIKKVEYSESISIASDAEVKEMVKL